MKKDIVLIGGGGHAKVIIDIINSMQEYNIVGICDIGSGLVSDIPIIGNDEILENLYSEGVTCAFICIGSLDRPQKRWKLYKQVKNIGYKLPILAHSTAILSPSAVIGEGTCIMPGAIINADTHIGKMCIINTRSVVEHDCLIGDNTHIAPAACLCGNIVIKSETHIGANATVKQGVIIGTNVIVGSGGVVINNIPDGVVVVGSPAKVKK